ncbi:cell envelope biogenesis protein TolA [Bartonella sp. WD16.2]|uniref:cell envelope biogenesis protein TolA n=1 Tax=Bartonella sp. WD16.2 TaxID=1933904 RepID=UPI00099A5CA3|nr:cell envelope biogenesis protein TolA [Bartonella sp. WD16.2]AQX20425.1 Cell division and transport-associated protein TolA [Bartonella sp. WD16.2]
MNTSSHHSMKKSLAFSLAAHIAILTLGGMHLTHSTSFPQHQLEAIPITLAPLDQELASAQGSENAPFNERPAPKPTTWPQEKEDAHHIGDGTLDSQTPLKPKEKLQNKNVETTPLSFGEKDASETKAQSLTTPKIQETKTQSSPQTTPEITSKITEETPKNENITLPEEPETPQITQIPAPTEPEKKPQQIVELPTNAPLPTTKMKPKPIKHASSQKSPHKKGEQTIEDILAMDESNLINRARTQGGGAKRSKEQESQGARKDIGDTTKMAQTLVNLAGACIQKKLKLVAIGGNLNNRPVVRLQFQLNRNGMIIGTPIIEALKGDESQQTVMIQQVYAAVFACQPYPDLPRDQYNLWGQGFDFNVDPLQEKTL